MGVNTAKYDASRVLARADGQNETRRCRRRRMRRVLADIAKTSVVRVSLSLPSPTRVSVTSRGTLVERPGPAFRSNSTSKMPKRKTTSPPPPTTPSPLKPGPRKLKAQAADSNHRGWHVRRRRRRRRPERAVHPGSQARRIDKSARHPAPHLRVPGLEARYARAQPRVPLPRASHRLSAAQRHGRGDHLRQGPSMRRRGG